MAYATLADVQSRMPQFTLTGASKPTASDAQAFLDTVHSQLDSAFENMGYVTPVTGPKAVAQAKEIAAQGAIALILFARAAAIGGDEAVRSAERAQKLYDGALKALLDPNDPRELVDAGRTGDRGDKPGTELDGLRVDDDGDAIEPRSSMDMNF